MAYPNNSSLCRICLQEGATVPIFEKNENGDNILSKISSCIEKIEDLEGYPRYLCSLCNTTLDTLCSFIYKYRESYKLLQSGLVFVKKEEVVNYQSDHVLSEAEIEIDSIKVESDDDDELNISLACLAKTARTKKKVKVIPKRTSKVKTRAGNQTNKIASSILEGNFKWNGEKCLKIGQTTLKRIPRHIDKNRPRPQTKVKVPKGHPKVPEMAKPKVDTVESAPLINSAPSGKLCDLCGEIFKDQDKLSIHKRKVHSNKTPVKCPKCPRECVSEYYLKRHIKRRHEMTKDFVCSTCGQGFVYKGELTNHIKNVHNKHLLPKKVYTCKHCGKTYKCPKSVIVHERSVHTGLRPEECKVCGSRFYHIDYLKEHMRLHTGETPFKCPICARGYAQLSNMKSHLRIHRISELDAATLSKLRPNYLKLLKG